MLPLHSAPSHLQQLLSLCSGYKTQKEENKGTCLQWYAGANLGAPGQYPNFSNTIKNFQNDAETDILSHLSCIEFNQEIDGGDETFLQLKVDRH